MWYVHAKKISLVSLLLFMLVTRGYSQDNILVLTPTPNGSEGNTLYKDISTFEIDAMSGHFQYCSDASPDDWMIAPTKTTIAGIKGKQFKVILGGMLTTNRTSGNSFGATSIQGGIDRSNTGELGVRNNPNNNQSGISQNKGMWLGLDLKAFPVSAYMKITKIKVRYVRTLTGCVVNRTNTLNSLLFSQKITPTLVDGQGWVDVSNLNCVVKGGTAVENLIAIFNSEVDKPEDSFRITGIELSIIENFDCTAIKKVDHPRLLLKAGEEQLIKNLVDKEPDFEKVHNYILTVSESMLMLPDLVYKLDANNRLGGIHQEAVYRILYLSYAYRMTRDIRFLNKAIENLQTFCKFPSWSYYSLDVCESACAAAIGYDWLFDQLSEEVKQIIREAIVNKGLKTQVGKPFWNMTSNWNQVCIGSLSMAAMAIYGDGTVDMDALATNVIQEILLKNPNSMNTYGNGNYPEGPMYWAYGTTYEVMMLSSMEGIYGKDHPLLNQLINTPGFLQSANYMQYVTGTSGLVYNYADGVEARNLGLAAFWMAKRLQDPSVLYIEKELIRSNEYTPISSPDIKLPLALIYGKDIDITRINPPTDSIWSGTGAQPVTFVRTGWQGSLGRYMGVKAGLPYSSHAHLDGGSFVYDAQGYRWGMDFGKEDYDAIKANIPNNNSFEQDAGRWDVFRHDNFSHNTLTIKRSSASAWQHHNVYGASSMDEVIETPASKGVRVNLSNTLGLFDELKWAFRTITLEDNSYLKVVDSISVGEANIDLYWNMATRAIATKVDNSTIKLQQGGKSVLLKFSCSDPSIVLNVEHNRSTDPVTYFPEHTYERKNPGTVMVGFTASVPSNTEVSFNTCIIDGPEDVVSIPTNQILLQIPKPLTAREGNYLYYDESRFDIAPTGEIQISGPASKYAWRAIGNVEYEEALGACFLFRWKAMGSTDLTDGIDYGKMLVKAGIDRSSGGEIGVRGGDGGGIDPKEGYSFGFDLSRLPASLALRLVEINIPFLNSGKQATIVNRTNTIRRKTIKSTDAGNVVDVRGLDIVASGGRNYPELAALINTGTVGGFRLAGFKFELIENPILSTDAAVKDERDKKVRILIYPNPVKDYIGLRSQEEIGHVKIDLYDITGACVCTNRQFINDQQEGGVDISHLNPGIYKCVVENDHQIITKTIIKE